MRFERVQALLSREATLVNHMVDLYAVVYDRFAVPARVSPLTVKVVWALSSISKDPHKVPRDEVLKTAKKIIFGEIIVPPNVFELMKDSNARVTLDTAINGPVQKPPAELTEPEIPPKAIPTAKQALAQTVGDLRRRIAAKQEREKELVAELRAVRADLTDLRQEQARHELVADLLSKNITDLEALVAKAGKPNEESKQEPNEESKPDLVKLPKGLSVAQPVEPRTGEVEARALKLVSVIKLIQFTGGARLMDIREQAHVSTRSVCIFREIFKLFPINNPLLVEHDLSPYWKQHPMADDQMKQLAEWIASAGWPTNIVRVSAAEIKLWAKAMVEKAHKATAVHAKH